MRYSDRHQHRGERCERQAGPTPRSSIATGENQTIEQEGRSLRLWPYRRGTALLASVFLLVVLLLALIGLRQANALPGDRIGVWLLLGAVLLGLVPVFLSVLDLVVERGGTVEAIFGREPGRTWVKTGFVKVLVQSGTERDPRLPDTPTIWEIMGSGLLLLLSGNWVVPEY